jgi:hypothetical protein
MNGEGQATRKCEGSSRAPRSTVPLWLGEDI